MNIETLTAEGPKLAASAAFYAASNTVAIFAPLLQSLDWIGLGATAETEDRGAAIQALTAFVRSAPGAPAEALYRWAGARGYHAGDATTWASLGLEWRTAYQTFVAAVPMFDWLIAEETERLAAIEREAGAPPIAAALFEDPRDTIFATAPDPLATNPNMVLVMTPSDAEIEAERAKLVAMAEPETPADDTAATSTDA